MIDIKEIQIGDWVMDAENPAQVTSLTCDGIIETTRRISNIEVIEPIPLTPEILEKNGFARDEIAGWRFRQYEDGLGLIYEIYWNNKGDELEIVSNFSKIGGFDKKGIQFVHQLQNAISLCEIEKEIEL